MNHTSSILHFLVRGALLIIIAIIIGPIGVFAGPPGNPALKNEVDITILQQQGNTENFKGLLEEAIEPIKDKLDNTNIGSITYGGADAIVIFVIDVFKTYVFPLLIVLALLTAVLNFIQIMFSDSEEKRNKAINYFIYGVIGIIIFVGAEFIFNNLYGIITKLASAGPGGVSRNTYAGEIFESILFPFLKLGMYLIMGGLFIMVLVKAVGYISDPNEKARENGKKIISNAVLGIIVIMLAKTMVEAVYGSQKKTLEDSGTLFVGGAILDTNSQNYQPIFTIINYVFGFLAFIILCLIVYQAYLLLFQSNTDEGIKKLRKNITYIFGGLVLIGLSYLIVNLTVIN
ncbi:MAG TPA: hypothetical protein PLW93_05245 [Candidatus Absconditabacterales bacterium]|nr:hypothetical protein [Candidatus Absconditabacterales bacterium]HNG97649.1 hypothetical protein [Candidatus Absconditabacterales bacterium]